MENNIYCVITFDSVGEAMLFEKKMKSHDIALKLIPAPRELSASCGIAAEVTCSDEERIVDLCIASKIDYEGFHKLKRK